MQKECVIARFDSETGIKVFLLNGEFSQPTVYTANKFTHAAAVGVLDELPPDGLIYSIDKVFTNNIPPS
jgi:hypothetical protein